jgi:hypothetical protein
VVELVDTQDLGSCAFGCEGSSPSFGTVLICSGIDLLRANSKAASGSFVASGEARFSIAAAI